MTIKEFIKKYDLSATCQATDDDADLLSPGHVRHKVKVRGWFKGKFKSPYQFNPDYNEFDLESFLDCIQSDCRIGENGFGNMLKEFGDDGDVHRQRKIWKACRKSYRKMKKFLGFAYEEFMTCEP